MYGALCLAEVMEETREYTHTHIYINDIVSELSFCGSAFLIISADPPLCLIIPFPVLSYFHCKNNQVGRLCVQ